MDPLSVAASIVGVLGAAAKVSSALTTFVQSVKGAPKLAQNVLSDVNGVSAVLMQLQLFLLGKTIPSKSGASLVLVEQVIVALQESVKVFSELEHALGTSTGDGGMGLLDRVKWTMKESKIADIQERLRRSRSTLFEMLTVLQWFAALLHSTARVSYYSTLL